MFDVGIWEMGVIGVVALVVLGPERLPKVARTAGHLFGRLQRYVANVKSDINREMEMSELAKVKEEVQSAARSFEQSVQDNARSLESAVASSAREVEQAATPSIAAPAASSAAPEAASQVDLLLGAPAPEPATAPTPASPVARAFYAAQSNALSFDLGIEPPRRIAPASTQHQP